MKWINCNDRLPEKHKKVLCRAIWITRPESYIEDRIEFYIDQIQDVTWKCPMYNSGLIVITHWAELPDFTQI